MTRNPSVAICVGHSRSGDQGAVSVTGATEWTYNSLLGAMLLKELRVRRIHAELITHYDGDTYRDAMEWVARCVAAFDVALELHFNSSPITTASGFEFLYCSASNRGELLAHDFTRSMRNFFKPFPSRGVKPRSRHQRGGRFLWRTRPVAVLCEPFFGSNPHDWFLFGDAAGAGRLARAYTEALVNFFHRSEG